jgi:hypothetical protein
MRTRRLLVRSQITDELCLGGFLYLRTKLDDLSGSPRCPFQRHPEVRRDVKLNHLSHDHLLAPANLGGSGFNRLVPPVTPPETIRNYTLTDGTTRV